MATATLVKSPQAANRAELDEELRQAERDREQAALYDVTIEQLDWCTIGGRLPWPEESRHERRP